MALRCYITSERVRLTQDLQLIRDFDTGKQEQVRQQSNQRIDAWILRRYADSGSHSVLLENDDGWALQLLADVAAFLLSTGVSLTTLKSQTYTVA